MDSDERLAEVLASYVERREAGGVIDEEALIAEHPELAEDLTAHFEAARFVDRALAGLLPAADAPTSIDAFRVERELGAGGMGTVYAATATEDMPGVHAGQRVALKLVHPHLLRRPGFFRRFMREADLGRRVRHENVVRTLFADACMDGATPAHYLVMEYVEGQTLRELLADIGQAPEELCIQIARDVTRALVAIHEAGVVHRDLKPDNVLITEEHVVKVMDLGVAQLSAETIRLSQTGAFVGSLHYAAPEQIEDPGTIDGRADLHALGLLLYELATGHNPFEADDARAVLRCIIEQDPQPLAELNPQTSPFFEELVHTLLRKDREQRFASAEELLGVLDAGETSPWWRDRARAIRARTTRPLRRIRIPRETAVYGREAELTLLRSLFDRAGEGAGQVLLIEGEAGIGKSRLLDEFAARLVRDGADVNFLLGSYPPAGAATALGAFAAAFGAQFGDDGCAPYLPQTPLLVAAFAALLRGDVPPMGAETLNENSLQTVFVHATRNLAAERPTVIVIEDLHFAPAEGRALFASLALAVPGHRVLLIATMRPGVPAQWRAQMEGIEHARRIELARLSPKDLVELLSETLRSAHLATELGGLVALKSDGNPFFVFELLRGLREGQFLRQHADGTWHTTGVMREIQVPSSIEDLVNARVADLTNEERVLLDVAACCGFEFEAELVGDALEMSRLPVLQTMARIEKGHRLVHAAGRRFVFDHHQVQEVLYASLPEPLRETYHAALGDAIEERTGAAAKDLCDLPGALCVDLSTHLLAGAEGRRALRYLDAAQQYLKAVHRNADAVELVARALKTPGLVQGADRARTLLWICGVSGPLDLMGRTSEQENLAREAVRLAAEGADTDLSTRAEGSLAAGLIVSGQIEEAETILRRVVESGRQRGDRVTEHFALLYLGNSLQDQGRTREADDAYESSLECARALREREPRAESASLMNLSLTRRALGHLDEAQRLLEEAGAIQRRLGDRLGEAYVLAPLANVLWLQGHLDAALRRHECTIAASRERGDRRGEAIALAGSGVVLALQARTEDARTALERSLAISVEIGDRHGAGKSEHNLAALLLRTGDPFGALHRFQHVVAIGREHGLRILEAQALSGLGRAQLALGRCESAQAQFTRQLALAREIGEPRGLASAHLNLALADREEGALTRSRDRLVEWIAAHDATVERSSRTEAVLLLGSVQCEAGERQAGRSSLREALELARELELHSMETLAAIELAVLGDGDASAARDGLAEWRDEFEADDLREATFLVWRTTGDVEFLAEARRLLDVLLSKVPEEYHEAMLTNVRVNREIAAAAQQAGL